MSEPPPSHAQARIDEALAAVAAAGGLVTPADLAREWSVTPQAVEERIRNGRFPEPVKKAGRVSVFLRAQVEHLRRS